VIAWLWARTVTCPNPACQAEMPLTNKWWLSKKKGREAWVEPVADRSVKPARVQFKVRTGGGKAPEGTVDRRGAKCVLCDSPVRFDHVRRVRELLIEAIRYGDSPEVQERLRRVVDERLDAEHLRSLLEERALAHDVLDSSRVQEVRDLMERARIRRLQPHFILSFFEAAFKHLGGTMQRLKKCLTQENSYWEFQGEERFQNRLAELNKQRHSCLVRPVAA